MGEGTDLHIVKVLSTLWFEYDIDWIPYYSSYDDNIGVKYNSYKLSGFVWL